MLKIVKPRRLVTERVENGNQILPNNNYTGRAFILVDLVSDPLSPDYGRREFRIELTVTEGRHKGKTVHSSRAVLPYYLANMPPTGSVSELKKWKGAVKNYFRQTDAVLAKCGVDISNSDKTQLVTEIAKTNKLKPIVKFNVANGIARVVNLINFSVTPNAFAENEPIPDGNDAPFN